MLKPYINVLQCHQVFGIGDHFPMIFNITVSYNDQRKTQNFYRKLKSVDLELFQRDITELLDSLPSESNFVTNSESVSFKTAVVSYNRCVGEIVDKHAPKCISESKKNDTPKWIDHQYILARAKRRRLERQYLASGSRFDKDMYAAQCRVCRKMIKAKKKDFYCKTLNEIGNNQKKLFHFVHEINGHSQDKSLPSSPADNLALATSFNSFFIDKIDNIRASLPAISDTSVDLSESVFSFVSHDSSCLSEFSLCTTEEVADILSIYGIKVSPADVFPQFLLNKSKEIMLPYLTALVNLSLNTGSIEGLKEAVVRPLLKELGIDPELYPNFRPISNLEFLGKLIERIVLRRLQSHMDTNNLNSHKQFGYKKKHGTETLLIKFLNDLIVGIDSKSGVVVLMMDLSAAFDTVDHRKLLNILCYQMNLNEHPR